MKTKNSIKNSIIAMITNFMTLLIGFIAQKIFINILNTEYLGINGLFTNIISMLGIVELGIGSAIIYNLYKPIVNKDNETIKSLMKFYKKSYNIIAIVVLLIGIAIMPFLRFFISEVSIDININLVYLLFVIDIVFSYLLSYKRSILYADQKNYIINIIHIIYLVILNVFQIIVLYITKNYYLYLIIKIIFRILENIIISVVSNKIYPFLLDKDIKVLDKKIEKDIFTKVKALFYHKVSAFIVLGSDNIIISKYLGIISVGLYSNYYLIINSINTLFAGAISALTPSVGNMLIEENKIKNYEVFKRVRFINFWISCFTSVCLLLITQPFISMWLGSKYLLSISTLVVLVFNYFQKMMRSSYSSFKEAAGIFYEDRYVPIIESIINIVASIILVKYFGITGVFLGTIISGLALWAYSYPKYVYKKLFDRSYMSYAKETVGYIFLFIIVLISSYMISNFIKFDKLFINLGMNVLISLLIPNIILIVLFCKTDNYKYYKNLLLSVLHKNK